ncbi:glycosyltransferase family 4 protein [Domibacillus sp.]|uniref:glycosyltransferase family 4 protein n=1 Tax=Domibacillus sp. TaxID=1969783 RepID=UPI0028118236|nr:glycosyltransferase family 4 protein [Domibacillus sp.]
MNITIVSLRGPTNSDLKGGAREYIKDLAKPWVQKGHKVTLICASESNFDLPVEEVVDGINVKRISSKGSKVGSIWKFYTKNYKKSTDLLVENMVSFPVFSPLFSKKEKNITIIHHLTGKEYFKSHNLPTAMLGYFFEEIAIPLFYKKRNIVTVSQLTKNELKRLGIVESNIKIISPGIDNEYFVEGKKSMHPSILYIGRYDGKNGVKKLDHLVEAYSMLKGEIEELELIIAGPTKYKDELDTICRDDKIKYLGFISEEQKRELYQYAWIFSSPSTREGFGITYIEANASGTPVVGYEIEGLDTVSVDSGILVEPNNIEKLKDALKELILNTSLRNEMSQKARINSEKYSKKKFIEKSLALISNHIGE